MIWSFVFGIPFKFGVGSHVPFNHTLFLANLFYRGIVDNQEINTGSLCSFVQFMAGDVLTKADCDL